MRVAKKFLVMILAVVMSMGLTVMGYAATGNDATRGTYSPKKDYIHIWDDNAGSERVYEGGSVLFVNTGKEVQLMTASLMDYEFGGNGEIKEDKNLKMYFNGTCVYDGRGREFCVYFDLPVGEILQVKYKKGCVEVNLVEQEAEQDESKSNNEDLLAQYYAALEKQQSAQKNASASNEDLLAQYYAALEKQQSAKGTYQGGMTASIKDF